MLKNVEPSLPPSNSFSTSTHNRLPIRHPRTDGLPKNKTGAFIPGIKSKQDISSRHAIPPLAQSRMTAATGFGSKDHPSLRQQQTVKQIHSRWNRRGGFCPQPIKKQKPKVDRNHKGNVKNPHVITGVPRFEDVARKSARNLVAVCNSGVTHLEELRADSYSLRSGRVACESMVVESVKMNEEEDIKSLVRLREFYKNVLEDSYGFEKASTRHGSSRMKSASVGTPLLIRSFRNPQSPHPVIQYAKVNHTSNSKPTHIVAKPPVPSPYFYNSRNLSKASDDGGSRVQLSRQSALTQSAESVLAAPGVGSLSRSALSSRVKGDFPMSIKGQRPPALSSRSKLVDSTEMIPRKEFRGPSVTPATSNTSIHKVGKGAENTGGGTDKKPDVVIPEVATELRSLSSISKDTSHPGIPQQGSSGSPVDPLQVIDRSTEPQDETNVPAEDTQSVVSNTMSIVISVEGEDGALKVIDIDEEEENNRRALENMSSAGNLEGNGCGKEESEAKEDELQQLLQEHSEIVTEIHKLEKLTCQDETDEGDNT